MIPFHPRLAAFAITLTLATSSWACRPYIPSFTELIADPATTVVRGRFVAIPPQTDALHQSDRFLVTEVLTGDIKPGTYVTVEEGSFGSSCEIGQVAHTEAAQDKERILVVQRVEAPDILVMHLGHAIAKLDGNMVEATTSQNYGKKQKVRFTRQALEKWLKDERKGIAPWLGHERPAGKDPR